MGHGLDQQRSTVAFNPGRIRPVPRLRRRFRGRYANGMTAAFEVSPDDPQGVAEAIRRAADGATVHLVRNGRPVAAIVPSATAREAAERDARGLAIERRMAERFGAPTLADYRRIYDSQGWSWPGDEVILRTLVVAEAS